MNVDWSKRPLAEHHTSLSKYHTISSLCHKGQFVDLIAIVASFTEIKPTKGADLQRALVICDHTAALPSTGLLVQFYRPTAIELPRPAVGSVIILNSFKLFDFKGVFQAWSHHSSSWIIYDPNGSSILSKSLRPPSEPGSDVAKYVKRLAGWWKTRAGISSSTELAVPADINSARSHSAGRATVTVKEIREANFYDVYGYVVKTYPSRDNIYTVYITDYTTNPQLHDYVYGEAKWSGPFGQQTIQVTLWDAHARYARNHIHEDQYVFLRNLQGKRGDMGRLEGTLRGDRQSPDKVNIIKIDSQDSVIKSIKLRKSQYENTWRLEKERLDEEIRLQYQADNVRQLTPPRSVNPNLETSYQQIPLTAIGDILEPPYVPQAERVEGPGGRKRALKYRTVGRIIDFWPSDLRDFSRPYCMACQATYSPKYPESALDGRPEAQAVCQLCDTLRDEDDPDTYEFAFVVLLEGQDGVCIPVNFSGDDIEVLLGEDIVPCNLYLRENEAMLGRLRERLFLLWGDLEERFTGPPSKKRASGNHSHKIEAEEAPLMWNEFCIMEYWVNEAGGKAGWRGRRFKAFGMAIQ